jgi:hypothetical protein
MKRIKLDCERLPLGTDSSVSHQHGDSPVPIASRLFLYVVPKRQSQPYWNGRTPLLVFQRFVPDRYTQLTQPPLVKHKLTNLTSLPPQFFAKLESRLVIIQSVQ